MDRLKKYITSITEFSDESWAILQGCITVIDAARNTDILKEGEKCNAVYFLAEGYCRSFYLQDGREINTGFYFENDFVTNLKSLTTSSRSEYFIRTGEKSKIFSINKTALLEAYKKSHQLETFGRKVLELISLKQEEHSNSFKLYTPSEQYHRLVQQHPHILQRVSLTQLSSYLGISRETLSRIRAEK